MYFLTSVQTVDKAPSRNFVYSLNTCECKCFFCEDRTTEMFRRYSGFTAISKISAVPFSVFKTTISTYILPVLQAYTLNFLSAEYFSALRFNRSGVGS